MTEINMAQFIAPKSNQMNADDLLGGPRTITITNVRANEGNVEQPVSIFFEGDQNKPFLPCKSMRRVMVAVWGADAKSYIGKSMTLFRDPEVLWGGMKVGGIRISHMTDLDKPKTMALTASKQKRTPYTVQPLKIEAKADKAAEVSTALIERVKAAADEEVAIIAGDETVQKQRAWLTEKRPELAALVNAAFDERAPQSATDDIPMEGVE